MLLRTRVGEQERVLEHEPDRAPHVAQARLAHVGAVDADVAGVDVVEAGDQPGDRRLPRRSRADERDRLARRDHQVEAVEHAPDRVRSRT